MNTVNYKNILLSPQISEVIKIKKTLLVNQETYSYVQPSSQEVFPKETPPTSLKSKVQPQGFSAIGVQLSKESSSLQSKVGFGGRIQYYKLNISGPLGTQSILIPDYFNLNIENTDNKYNIKISETGFNLKNYKIEIKSLISQINKMIKGVTEGYTKQIKLVGIGYKINYEINNKCPTITLNIGFSHPVIITNLPSNISVSESAIKENKADPSVLELNSTSLIELNNFINSIVKLRPVKKSFKGTGIMSVSP